MEDCFTKQAIHLFSEFKKKDETIKKIDNVSLSAKRMRDGTLKLAKGITNQQIMDINSACGLSIAFSDSCDVADIAQVALLGRYVNSEDP